jgi:SAM-dependent methyltransferase
MPIVVNAILIVRRGFPMNRRIRETQSGNKWRAALLGWSIPENILAQAPTNPWIHPPVYFEVGEIITDSISHQRAREALPRNGSILDIGCGGGVAAFACVPPARKVIGVDHQPEMLEMFTQGALKRGVESETFEGFWPAIAPKIPKADVVAAHHVVYNVQNIEEFLLKMSAHALERVVVEMPQQHPQNHSASLWKHFWKLERPFEPTPQNLLEVLQEIGIKANLELWEGEMRRIIDLDQEAYFSTIRLCLPQSRQDEVRAQLELLPHSTSRPLATLWWDVA